MALRVPFPLFDKHSGQSKRASVTCHYKCGDACYRDPSNTSDNAYFGDIVRSMSRRDILKGSATVVVAAGATSLLAACGSSGGDDGGSSSTAAGAGGNGASDVEGMKFTPVAPNKKDAVVIPEGYDQSVVIRWGDPVVPGAPEFDFWNQTGAAQEKQFGFNNDFAGLIPIDGQAGHSYLCCNLEYTTEVYMFKGFKEGDQETEEQTKVAMAAHGIAIVEVKSDNGSGKLTTVIGPRNRRITASTPMELRGPAAGSEFVKTSDDPNGTKVLGTIANCSGGITPWGTMLSGEENWNNYFINTSKVTDKKAADRLDRYGFDDEDVYHRWGKYEKRFDLAQEPNEANRFGYVVEVNPHDPKSTPVKHSALGRNKHEAATIYTTPDGTVVAYSGDDEKFEYMYKFVAKKKKQDGFSRAAMEHNMSILDSGTLYVAKFTGNEPDQIDGSGKLPSSGKFAGKGQWVPLLEVAEDGKATSKIDGMSAQEVAVFTRLAADKAGATKMDRPEDFEPNPKTGKVYCALTNNSDRGKGKDGKPAKAEADQANPRKENKNGQIIELTDNHAGTDFTWELLLVCGDPKAADTYFGGYDKNNVSPISCPDNVAFDPHGNLWIATDGNALKNNDGLFAVALDGENRGQTKQFLTVPIGAETCGPIIQSERVLVCVQHPGELDDNNVENPGSHWPDGGKSQPRPAVVAVWKRGGTIGS